MKFSALFLQGKLEAGDVLTEAGIVAQVRAPKTPTLEKLNRKSCKSSDVT
jgi:hypothetical protein